MAKGLLLVQAEAIQQWRLARSERTTMIGTLCSSGAATRHAARRYGQRDNPTGGNVNVTNPTAGNVDVANPNAGQSDAPNPNARQSDARNPNVPVGAPGDLNVVVSPATAAAGDTIAVAGKGFTANGRGNLVFVNVVGADGVPFDTGYTAITCVETDNVYLGLLQDLGWGCSSGANGPLNRSADDGTFRASITVPAVAVGDAKVCISSVFSNPVCTPLTVQDGGG